MQEEQGSGLADHVLLAADVLIAAQGHLAHLAQMGARHEPCAAHGTGDPVRIVHDLQVKGLAGINGRVLMGVLADALAALVVGGGKGHMQEVVVKDRGLAHQAAYGAGDQGQAQQAFHGRALGIGAGQRRPGGHLRDVGPGQDLAIGTAKLLPGNGWRYLADGVHELAVDLVGHDGVEPKEAPGDKARHLFGGEKRQSAHAFISTSCSKKNSYFR